MLLKSISDILEAFSAPEILVVYPKSGKLDLLRKELIKGNLTPLYDISELTSAPLYTISLLLDTLNDLPFEEIDPLLEKLSTKSRYIFATVSITADRPLTHWESLFSNDFTRMKSSSVQDDVASLFYKSDSSFKDFR